MPWGPFPSRKDHSFIEIHHQDHPVLVNPLPNIIGNIKNLLRDFLCSCLRFLLDILVSHCHFDLTMVLNHGEITMPHIIKKLNMINFVDLYIALLLTFEKPFNLCRKGWRISYIRNLIMILSFSC